MTGQSLYQLLTIADNRQTGESEHRKNKEPSGRYGLFNPETYQQQTIRLQKKYKNLIALSILNSSPFRQDNSVVMPKNIPPKESYTLTQQRAFSVTELLIVIAVVAVLLALLIPVTQQAMRHAHKTQCTSNLKQVFVALRAYAFDRSGRLPGFSAADVSSFGPLYTAHRKLVDEGYLPNSDVLFCPADMVRRPLRDETGWALNPEQNNSSFTYSGYFHFYHRVGSLEKTSLPDDKSRARISDNPRSIVTSCQWTYYTFKAFHKDGGINILRLSGAVEWISPDVMNQGTVDGVSLYYRLEE